jgi:hypothetical protein
MLHRSCNTPWTANQLTNTVRTRDYNAAALAVSPPFVAVRRLARERRSQQLDALSPWRHHTRKTSVQQPKADPWEHPTHIAERGGICIYADRALPTSFPPPCCMPSPNAAWAVACGHPATPGSGAGWSAAQHAHKQAGSVCTCTTHNSSCWPIITGRVGYWPAVSTAPVDSPSPQTHLITPAQQPFADSCTASQA